jgi:branched-chain amino acid transport system permease protein
LAFVLVYKSSRMINFAVGEWIMFGALLAGAGHYAIGLGLAGAALFAALGMAVFGIAFNGLIVRRLTGHPVISLIMVTIGLGAVMRGAAALVFTGIPSGLPLPVTPEPLLLNGLLVSPEKLMAALIAGSCIGLLSWFYQYSRTGIELRAIADDPNAASAAGINVHRQFAIVWAITGVTSAVAGILWILVNGGGFGVALVGLKIFPIVIIGGLDCLPGTIIAAMLIGIFESLGAGYLDPQLGPGFGTISSYVLLLAMLLARPYGLFGHAPARRV